MPAILPKPPPNPFDEAARYLARLTPWPFLCWLLRLPRSALRFVTWLNAEQAVFPGSPARRCDTLADVEDRTRNNVPWAIPVEFQITPDPEMFGRGLVYLGLVWLTERPTCLPNDRYQVGMVVVNLTGVGDSSRDAVWPEAGLRTQGQIVEWNLERVPAATVLAEVATDQAPWPVLALIPLMTGGGDADTIAAWHQVVAQLPDPRAKAEAGALALVFAEAANRSDPSRRTVWQKALEGWNVVESLQVQEWQRQAEERGEERGRILGAYEMLVESVGPAAALAAVIRKYGEAARAIIDQAEGQAPAQA
jgi:hypothetical protein